MRLLTTKQLNKIIDEAYDKGYVEGENDGLHKGYDEGYSEKEFEAESEIDSAYQEGFEEGELKNKDSDQYVKFFNDLFEGEYVDHHHGYNDATLLRTTSREYYVVAEDATVVNPR